MVPVHLKIGNPTPASRVRENKNSGISARPEDRAAVGFRGASISGAATPAALGGRPAPGPTAAGDSCSHVPDQTCPRTRPAGDAIAAGHHRVREIAPTASRCIGAEAAQRLTPQPCAARVRPRTIRIVRRLRGRMLGRWRNLA